MTHEHRQCLTEKLGTGIVTTAKKGEIADAAVVEEVSASMCELNRDPAVLSQWF